MISSPGASTRHAWRVRRDQLRADAAIRSTRPSAPAYMSPERRAGPLVTPASDIYSLGCLLHELLTGDVPFHGSTPEPLRVHPSPLSTSDPLSHAGQADTVPDLQRGG